MSTPRFTAEERDQLRELAAWGKIASERAFGADGPGLGVDFRTMEPIATAAARGRTEGTLQQMLPPQAQKTAPDGSGRPGRADRTDPPPPPGEAATAEERRVPRRVVAQARTDPGNHRDRTDYPRYRRGGSPTTRSRVESLVGEVTHG